MLKLLFLLIIFVFLNGVLPGRSLSGETVLPNGNIVVIIDGFDTDNGEARCSLFDSEEKFPHKGQSLARSNVPIVNGIAKAHFDEIPYGYFAVSLFHDENSNHKLDRNITGWPKEKVAFSNNHKLKIPFPSWEELLFEHNHEQTVLHINLEENSHN